MHTVKLFRIATVPLSLYKLLTGQLYFMSQNGFEVIAISSDGPEIELVKQQEKCRYLVVNMTRIISPFPDLISLWQFVRLFKKEKPVIVHTHTPKAGFLGMMAAWICRVPIRLHTVAGLPLMETKGTRRKILGTVEKLTYACATKIYPNSQNLTQFILKNKYCSSKKIKVLGNGSSNGIDTEYFKPSPLLNNLSDQLKKELNIKEQDFVFVFVGRLVKDKGIEELLEAFCSLKKKHLHIKLLLVGSFEPQLDPLSDKALSMISNDKDIICAGFQNDIRPYLAVSSALAFPSYREGFPNVPMQAGCFDLPSIVTDINGCNEIIEHEINGLIIPAKSAEALYNAMERLITDEHLYLQIKLNARKMIVDRYEQKYFWSLLLEEYKNQLKNYGIVS